MRRQWMSWRTAEIWRNNYIGLFKHTTICLLSFLLPVAFWVLSILEPSPNHLKLNISNTLGRWHTDGLILTDEPKHWLLTRQLLWHACVCIPKQETRQKRLLVLYSHELFWSHESFCLPIHTPREQLSHPTFDISFCHGSYSECFPRFLLDARFVPRHPRFEPSNEDRQSSHSRN